MNHNQLARRTLRRFSQSLVIPLALIAVSLSGNVEAADRQACLDACAHHQKHCEREASSESNHAANQCESQYRRRLENCAQEKPGSDGDKSCRQAAYRQYADCDSKGDGNDEKAQARCDDNYQQCVDKCPQANGGGNAGYATEECRDGLSRDNLGRCAPNFTAREKGPGIAGCPPGEAPGKDDRCVPIIEVLKPAPEADGYVRQCNPGFKPSPIDGRCVPNDSGTDTVDFDRLPGQCPPGEEPGPNDGACVPKLQPSSSPFGGVEERPRLAPRPGSKQLQPGPPMESPWAR